MDHRASFALYIPNGNHPPDCPGHQRPDHWYWCLENVPESVERAQRRGHTVGQNRIRSDDRCFRRVRDSSDRILSFHAVHRRSQNIQSGLNPFSRPLDKSCFLLFLVVRSFPNIAQLQIGGIKY